MTSTPLSTSLMPLATAGVLNVGKENVHITHLSPRGREQPPKHPAPKCHQRIAANGLTLRVFFSYIPYVPCPASSIRIFIITYLSQNSIISGFKIFIVVFGDQHLNLIRLWLPTTWKVYVS